MFGWSRTTGSAPFFGFWPLRIAGTATVVEAETVVVLRYQVERAASLAKFGNRFASIPPSARCRSITGNSSRSRKTIGVVAWVRIAAASAVPLEITSFEVGECSRNKARKTTGAAASTFRNERAAGSRHTASAIADPIRTAPPISATVPFTPERLSTCTPKTAPRKPRKTRCRTKPAEALSAPTTNSTASSSSAGTNVTTSANTTMSPGVEPRTAKNSAFLPSSENKGCASAKPEAASSCAPRLAGTRRRPLHATCETLAPATATAEVSLVQGMTPPCR